MNEGRPAPSGARASQKRRAILHTAREAFLRDGFEVGLDRIAAEAGVSKMTVYNHFRSKEILFTAIVEGALDEGQGTYLAGFETRIAESTDLRSDLTEFCELWVASLTAPEMISLRNLVSGELRRFPELGEAWLTQGPAKVHAAIAGGLDRLVERGELSIPDVNLAVLQLSGLVLSPHLVYGTYGEAPDTELTGRLIRSGVDMFLNFYQKE
jgi:TetR/AcrR family transcriptional repressor of mexJK operon